MNAKVSLFALLLPFASVSHAGEQPPTAVQKARIDLQKLKEQSDGVTVSNESQWMMYLSKTESVRIDSINDLKAQGDVGIDAVREELKTAQGEYRQMLTIALASFGDKAAISETANLMLKAEKPAVRVVAAIELRRLKNKELIEPFKQALSAPFERMDGSCFGQVRIYPVRIIASDALVELGLSLVEVRELEKKAKINEARV